jgi:hypothetical protein
MASGERFNQITGNTEHARRYAPGQPAGGATIGHVEGQKSVHAATIEGAIPYVSDRPYVPPSYNERPTCAGTRTNGSRCNAKASVSGSQFCEAHLDQER